MKNIFIYITIISIFSFNSFAQKAEVSRIEKKNDTTQKVPDTIIEEKSNDKKIIKSYRVQENINLRFGGYTLTYEVLDKSLIDTYDLGPNNTRVITPSYRDVKQVTTNQIETLKSTGIKTTQNEIKPTNTNIVIPAPKEAEKELSNTPENELIDNSKKNDTYVYVHLIKVYERIAEKGYKSIEIFQKLGDSFFFDGEYTKSVRWYGELFKMTTNLDSQFYDRYSHALSEVGQKNKSEEIMKKRKQLFGDN